MLFSGYKLPFLISFVFACTQSLVFAQDVNATLDTNTSVNQTTIKPGRILGRVFDADSGEALKDVTVVLEDQNRETMTDLEGRYRLSDIAPGNYSLLFFKENYQRTRVKVEGVVSGRSKLVDLPLNPDYSNLETLDAFEITAEDLAGSDIQLLALRQESMVVMDAMGSFDMSRLGAGNVADALTKMVGTSVQDGKYVVVRGLADRYSNATFNGVPIPSSDVYRNTPQLDLFPSMAVENITILKSMSPDLGAGFAGGSVNIKNKAYPEELIIKIKASSKYSNSVHSNGSLLSYGNANDNSLGYGISSYQMPETYSLFTKEYLRDNDNYLRQIKNDPAKINNSSEEKLIETNDFMKSFKKDWLPKSQSVPLGHSVGLEAGNLFEWEDTPIGFVFSLDFEKDYSSKENFVSQKFVEMTDLSSNGGKEGGFLKGSEGKISSEIGSFLQLSMIPNENHEVGLIMLYSHTADKIARDVYSQQKSINGSIAEDGSTGFYLPFRKSELAWLERDMMLPQIYGDHILTSMYDTKVSWRVSKSMISLDEPNRRFFTEWFIPGLDPTEDEGFKNFPIYDDSIKSFSTPAANYSSGPFADQASPKMFWRHLEDESNFHRMDFEFPEMRDEERTYTFHLGFSGNSYERKFDEFEFDYDNLHSATKSRVTPTPLTSTEFPSEKIPQRFWLWQQGISQDNFFDDQHIGYVNGQPKVLFKYSPQNTPRDYIGKSKITSIYFKNDIDFGEGYSLSMGVRKESFSLSTTPIDNNPVSDPNSPFYKEWLAEIRQKNIELIKADLVDDSYFPSFIFAKSFEDEFKISLAAGKTTARPNFREIAEVESTDPLTNEIFKGNSDLISTEINNYDIRFDWLPSESEIFSTSFFYKELLYPIQKTFGGNVPLVTIDGKVKDGYSSDHLTMINSESAEVYGIEFEMKKELGSWSSMLENFRLGGNLVWSQSSLSLSEYEKSIFDIKRVENTEERELEGQSEWIFNTDLSFSIDDLTTLTLVYSFYGERLYAVSPTTTNDIYEDSYSELNFIGSYYFGKENDWSVKFSAKNLLPERRIRFIKNSENVTSMFETDSVFSVSLSKQF